MSGSDVFWLAWTVFIIVGWILGNDHDVATVTAKPGVSWTLAACVALGTLCLVMLPLEIMSHDWRRAVTDAVVGALCARVVWAWWRRRRQGRPSRVLGLVRDMGHKLGVVAVPVPVTSQ